MAGEHIRRDRRRGAAIGASVFVHIVVLALIGLSVPQMVLPPTPLQTHDVWLMPRLTLQRPEPPRPSKSHPAQTRPSPPTPIVSNRKSAPTRLNAPSAIPQGPASAAKGAPPQPGADDGRGVQEALRTSVGCDAANLVHLTPEERDRCSQHYGETARAAPRFSGIEPGKRSRFDAQADSDERRRAGRTGALPPGMAPCAGPGSNLGVGCLPNEENSDRLPTLRSTPY